MIRWADAEQVGESVRAYADELRERSQSIRRIIWYGSWISGVPTPRSDVDLCIVLESDDRRPRDRIPGYLPERFPVGIDLIVLTEPELEQLERRSPSWYRAIESGREV